MNKQYNMKHVIFIVLFFFTTKLCWSQNQDTTENSEPKVESVVKSTFNKEINRERSKIDSLRKVKFHIDSSQLKKPELKTKIQIDSNTTGKLKTSVSTQLIKQVSPIETNLSKSKSTLKAPIKKAKEALLNKKNISFSGEIKSDNYFTTAQNPLMRNELQYSRLYITPTITLLGLPFKGNVFLTTENNNTYRSDFFTFRFDANAYRQMAAKQMQNQINEAKKIDRQRALDLQKNQIESQRFENEYQQLKSNIPNSEQIQQALKQKAEEKTKAIIAQQEEIYKEKLKNATEEEIVKLENELQHQKDSILFHYQKQVNDSFLNSQDLKKDNIDSTQLAKLLKAQEKLEELKQKKQKLEQLRQSDSAQLMQKMDHVRNPDDLKQFANEQFKGNKWMKQILAVDRFGIGIVNPQYSESTIESISIKGLDIGVNQKNYFYDLTIGKTTQQFLGLFSNTSPEYNRNIGIIRFGIGELKKNHVGMEVMHAFDPQNKESILRPIKNTVYNLFAQQTLLKNSTIQGHFAQSNYRELKNHLVKQETPSTYQFKQSAFQSYKVKATHLIKENTKIEIYLQQTGIGFRTVGNPFLRKNFREIESKIEQKLFKNKLKLQANYKEMRDNLIEIGPSTNRIKGYGFKASSAFTKLPNFTLSYSPYQQGNNHPDSLFRTNNQFSITSAIITYKRRFKAVNWMSLLSYTRSAMELNNTRTVAYKMINSMQTFQIGNKNTFIIALMKNTTAPYVDTLNSSSCQLTHTLLISHKLSLSSVGEYTQFARSAFKAGMGLQVNSTLFKNFTIGISSRYDRINGIWNLQNANVFTGRLVASWKW